MVEFDFDIKSVFSQDIVKISARDLNACNYHADPEIRHKMSRLKTIIDHMGKLSAAAQDLKAPITTAEKIQYSDNTKLYLMASLSDKGKDSVVGLLKVGKKDLYLYDEMKQQRKVRQVPCILDFYIYELCQRAGYGKRLFEKMLHEENWKPNKCSIDRPSEKLKGFLRKHYGLEKTIPQGYKFVLYKGFFDDQREQTYNENPSTSNSSQQENQIGTQNRTRAVEYKPQQTSISAEHFGAKLDVFGYNSRCLKKLSQHCVTEHPCYNVEVIQTPNK